jgi:hypothetical protein
MMKKIKGVNGKGSSLFYLSIFIDEPRKVVILLRQDSLLEAGSSMPEAEVFINPSRCSFGKRL